MIKLSEIEVGSVLGFKCTDDLYRVLICTDFNKGRSPQLLLFAITDLITHSAPKLEDAARSMVYGKAGPNYNYSNSEVESMWNNHPEIKPNVIGTYHLLISRKTLQSNKERFINLGDWNIVEDSHLVTGRGMNADDIGFLDNFLINRVNTSMLEEGQDTYMTQALFRP